MRKVVFVMLAALCTVALIIRSIDGEAPAPAAAAEEKATGAGQDSPEPEELLRQMADFLCNLPAFSCHAEITMRLQGPGIERSSSSKLTVRLERPNRLALTVEEDDTGMNVVSDGKQVFQYLSALNRYVVREAPADMSGFSDSGSGLNLSVFGKYLPTTADEFYKTLTEAVTKSEYVGTEKIGEVLCHRCRFVQENVSWEIWIEAGDRPVVHKVQPDLSPLLAAAGEKFADAKLEYTVTFSDWDVAPKFTDADFTFVPPADAEQVESLFDAMEEEGPHPLLGQPAPAFDTVDPDGHPISLKNHLGKNVIILDFWATWCGPCIEAMPEIEAVAKKFADRGLVFYAVNGGEDADTVKEFLKSNEIDVPVAMDPDNKVNELYQVSYIPHTVLIGKDGKVQVVHVGFSGELSKILTADIEALLAGKDLASEALAKVEEAKKKRAARETQDESAEEAPGKASEESSDEAGSE